MKGENKLKFVSIFTALYLIVFTIVILIYKNLEFLYYMIIIAIFIAIAVYRKKTFYLTPHLIISLSILGFLHLAGGVFHPFGIRLYDFYLIKNILRYDNLIHSFAIFITTFIGYNLLKPHINKKFKNNTVLLALILILIAMGTGAFIEIIEFIAVVFLRAAERVGDYFNNTWDLIFNLIGSIIASIIIIYHHKRELNNKSIS